MQEFDFFSPRILNEVYTLLEDKGGKLIAGGTDVIPQMANDRFQTNTLVDISYLDELDFIKQDDGIIHIGALTKYSSLINSELIRSSAPLLVEAADSVGAIQTQNRGTIAGNIGNASPAGDLLPPLLVLDAVVTLTNREGERHLPLEEFLLGPGKTAIKQGEIIHHISIQGLDRQTRSTFIKLGNRKGMAISVVNAAVLLKTTNENLVEAARIALGAVAPTPIRCKQAENHLLGKKVDPTLLKEIAKIAASESSPISDIRASADYRRLASQVLVQRGLEKCLS